MPRVSPCTSRRGLEAHEADLVNHKPCIGRSVHTSATSSSPAELPHSLTAWNQSDCACQPLSYRFAITVWNNLFARQEEEKAYFWVLTRASCEMRTVFCLREVLSLLNLSPPYLLYGASSSELAHAHKKLTARSNSSLKKLKSSSTRSKFIVQVWEEWRLLG